jgi:hypothetical protein
MWEEHGRKVPLAERRDDANAHLMPRAARTIAMPMPVLPDVGSSAIVSGPIRPAFCAASIIATAMRSLTLFAGS